MLGAPGPTAITVASGKGLFVADVGKKMPEAVFYAAAISMANEREKFGLLTVSGLKRWTSTRSSKGMTDLMDLKVAWAA